MDIETIKTLISFAAIIISVTTLFMTKLLWRQTNRPIVVAFIEEDSSGNNAAIFKLIVANSGNRPATHVRLVASENEISKLIEQNASPERKKAIFDCFEKSQTIPLLRNGEQLSTAFGAFLVNDHDGFWLIYESQINISIEYCDLENNYYESNLPLKVYAREGFGGSVWS